MARCLSSQHEIVDVAGRLAGRDRAWARRARWAGSTGVLPAEAAGREASGALYSIVRGIEIADATLLELTCVEARVGRPPLSLDG
jgi:hypothetical protein